MRTDDIAKIFVKQAIKEQISDRENLQKLKNRFSTEYKISSLTSVEVLRAYDALILSDEIDRDTVLEGIVRKRGVRSLSGIASVTVITKDYACPGKCIYCPKEPEMPKSYLSNEPACMRAILNDFDPYKQVVARLKGLKKTGHETDKIELIISGGTFNFYPRRYQSNFVRGVFNGLNFDIGGVVGGVDKGKRGSRQNRVKISRSRSLLSAQKINESANNRCVGLSVETRPDYISEDELKYFRKLGVTKVEVGVQCLCDEIYRLNKRGHGVEEVRSALKLLKDAGFKINVHFMPNMYGSSLKKDLDMFKTLFDDESFRPDWLKIYPCVVVPYSPLEKLYRQGKHKTYSDKELIKLLCKMKKIVPEYCRITRLYRDIPAESIIGGSKLSNLRQYVQAEMVKMGAKCKCIRCREIKGEKYDIRNVELIVRTYDSSGGKEYFLSFEDVKNDKLIAYLRLRIPSHVFSGEIHWMKDLKDSSVIRELHVFGEHVPLGHSGGKDSASQHLGFGRKLIDEAKKITVGEGLDKLSVISGVGVREYYRKLGFKDGDLYQFLKL